MDTFDLLIFDLDGTLIDSRDDIATAVNLTLKEIGLPTRPVEELIQWIGCGARWLIEQAAAPHFLPPPETYLPLFRKHYHEHLLDETALYPDVQETLKFFRDLRMAVATNKPMEHTIAILEGLGIAGYFQKVMGGDSTPKPKPDPAMILETLDALQVGPERALMIGDGVNDLQAARAAGVRSCAVTYGVTDPSYLLRENPDFICHAFREIPMIIPDSSRPE